MTLGHGQRLGPEGDGLDARSGGEAERRRELGFVLGPRPRSPQFGRVGRGREFAQRANLRTVPRDGLQVLQHIEVAAHLELHVVLRPMLTPAAEALARQELQARRHWLGHVGVRPSLHRCRAAIVELEQEHRGSVAGELHARQRRRANRDGLVVGPLPELHGDHAAPGALAPHAQAAQGAGLGLEAEHAHLPEDLVGRRLAQLFDVQDRHVYADGIVARCVGDHVSLEPEGRAVVVLALDRHSEGAARALGDPKAIDLPDVGVGPASIGTVAGG